MLNLTTILLIWLIVSTDELEFWNCPEDEILGSHFQIASSAVISINHEIYGKSLA